MSNQRALNMRRVSVSRSAEVNAMLDFLLDLDNGANGDFGGFVEFKIQCVPVMKGRINSYRAQKIARYLGKNISKSHLIKFSKGDLTEKDRSDIIDKTGKSKYLNRLSVDEFIDLNSKGLLNYWKFIKGFYVNQALIELDKRYL